MAWVRYVEHNGGDDWVSACRNVEVVGGRVWAGAGRLGRECVKDDMDELGSHAEWAVFRDMWRGFISGQMFNPSCQSMEEIDVLKINDDDYYYYYYLCYKRLRL